MGVSKNRGGPPKWMVKIMENPIKMDDLGYHYFWKHPYIYIHIYTYVLVINLLVREMETQLMHSEEAL